MGDMTDHIMLDRAKQVKMLLLRRAVINENGCMEFQGALTRGYGSASIGNEKGLLHRLVYKYLVAPIPENLFVLHRCDNPSCVNPEHLFIGTQQDNVQDCIQKGRRAHKYSKKKFDDVILLRAIGMSYTDIAMLTGLNHRKIQRLCLISTELPKIKRLPNGCGYRCRTKLVPI